ncbi:MAG: hypothetical protein H8D96_00860 [Desulfobacterales bacterium]|uniref:Uncharacterized protein n=1 Tax=Candidatus Desulfatibia vada TaxID=2841696 RepID=A0A8J6TKK6_9BACT|nr:hypothetical protein [Candidatus Desulfatibia vada]
MAMTSRGATLKGGSKAVTSPFMDGGIFQRISITVDNSYNRGRIPAYSLWAPSDKSSNPWKYMPYIPCINIEVANSTTSLDIPNAWVDYFRAGDEVLSLVTAQLAVGTDNLRFDGKSQQDVTANTLGTDSCTISAVGKKDSGGTGNVLITLADAFHTSAPTGGARGTGDILVLTGSSTSTAIKSHEEADTVVIMEQEFDFADAITGTVGEGGYLVESCVYAYSGRIDTNYLEYYPNLNTFDASPAYTACGKFTNFTRFNFESIYRG